MKEPKRSDFPAGKDGDKQYQQALVNYKKWLKENTNTNPAMDLPAIQLPGLPRNPSDVEAKNWFKFVAPRAPKGSEAKKYYDSIVGILKGAGVAQKDWAGVWADAVDWTQTIGNDSNGDPRKFFNTWSPGSYVDKSTKKYGTTAQRTETTTQYSPSNAAADISRTFEQEIGRTASQAEIDAYIKGVNDAAKKEPAIYEGTTTTAPGKGGILETSKTKATSTTGFDPTIYAQNFARSRPDFAESFATKNFLKIIQGLLKDPNAIGTVVE